MAAVVAADGVVDLAAAGLAVAEVVEDLVDLVEEVQVEAVLEADGRLFIERGKNTMHKKSRTNLPGFFCRIRRTFTSAKFVSAHNQPIQFPHLLSFFQQSFSGTNY
jgi:hypothetical protein